MQNVSNFRQHNTIAKQGVMPSSWLAINSLSYDRLPECSRVQEGWDDQNFKDPGLKTLGFLFYKGKKWKR